MATHLPVVTATGPRGPFLLDLSMFSPQEMAGVFQLPWCTTVLVWDEVWAIFPPLSNGALNWERLLSQGCLGMKTAQPSGVHPFHGEVRMGPSQLRAALSHPPGSAAGATHSDGRQPWLPRTCGTARGARSVTCGQDVTG